MLNGSLFKHLFNGYMSDHVEVTEHLTVPPYRDVTRISTPIWGTQFVKVYVAKTAKDYWMVYYPEILQDFPKVFPEWAKTIAHKNGASLDLVHGIHEEVGSIKGLGIAIFQVATAVARIDLKLAEISSAL